jgi:DNA-binding transcriptional MerR regulator
MGERDLTRAQVARLAGCHVNTVLRYEAKGLIRAQRDRNNFRRFPIAEAIKLKELLTQRMGDFKYEY